MKSYPKIIAHRGFWKSNPETTENSIQALKNAQELDIYGSELDVVMTKDGVLVVNHDDSHFDMDINKHNYEDLVQLKLSNGEDLPKLKDYLIQGSKSLKLKLIIELKPILDETKEIELVDKSLAIIKDLNLESQCEFISFSLHICRLLKKISPSYIVYYLGGDLSPSVAKSENFDGIDYDYLLFLEHPEWISEAKDLGLLTNSWTINEIDILKVLLQQNIDFVTTDRPDLFLSIKS